MGSRAWTQAVHGANEYLSTPWLNNKVSIFSESEILKALQRGFEFTGSYSLVLL